MEVAEHNHYLRTRSDSIIGHIFQDLPNSGRFGDSFGAIQALFSALALGGIILVILMQNRELVLEREELKYTRMEIGRQVEQFSAAPAEAVALKADIELIRKQFSWFFRRFRPYFTNFFSMLEIVDHNRIGQLGVNIFYIGLLRSQLSDYELMFISYYALTNPKKDRYVGQVDKYHLFADLDVTNILNGAHTGYFGAAAFAEKAESGADSTA